MDEGGKHPGVATQTRPVLSPEAERGFAGRVWHELYGQAYVLLALTTLMWAGNAIAGRLAVGHVSPMALTSLRWIAVLLIVGLALRRQIAAEWPALKRHWLKIFLMGSFGMTGFNALYYAAAHYTTAVNLTLIQGSIPILVLIGSLAVFGTRIGLLQGIGSLVTLVGVAVIGARGEWETFRTLDFNIGDVWMVIACVFYAGFTIALRNRPPVSAFVLFFAFALSAFLSSLGLLGAEIATGTVQWPDATAWLILAFVAVFPSLLSQIFFMRGVELIGPGRAGLFVNLVPVFGAILAVAILNEPFRPYHAVALALVLGGISLAEASLSQRNRRLK
jgi:drug/metabolite transporter (DMT)-like permease